MPTQRGLRWIFTINNYTDDELAIIRGLVATMAAVSFLCFGLEVGEQEGTPHVQGYLELDQRLRTAQVCSALGGRARVALSAKTATLDHNKEYCSKTRDQDTVPNEVYEEYGVGRVAGTKRGKSYAADEVFQSIVEDIDQGLTLVEIIRRYPREYAKFHGGIDKMLTHLSQRHQEAFIGPVQYNLEPQIDYSRSYICYGKTQVGKTGAIIRLRPKALFVTHVDDLKAFGSGFYDSIIFDDCSFLHMPDRTQLNLVDQDFDRSIHVRYGTVRIPRHTPKFFLHNSKEAVVNWMEFPEIKRRCSFIHFKNGSFFFE